MGATHTNPSLTIPTEEQTEMDSVINIENNQNKTKQITVYLNKADQQRLEDYSKLQDQTVSDAAGELLKAGLTKYELEIGMDVAKAARRWAITKEVFGEVEASIAAAQCE